MCESDQTHPEIIVYRHQKGPARDPDEFIDFDFFLLGAGREERLRGCRLSLLF